MKGKKGKTDRNKVRERTGQKKKGQTLANKFFSLCVSGQRTTTKQPQQRQPETRTTTRTTTRSNTKNNNKSNNCNNKRTTKTTTQQRLLIFFILFNFTFFFSFFIIIIIIMLLFLVFFFLFLLQRLGAKQNNHFTPIYRTATKRVQPKIFANFAFCRKT